MVRTSRMIVVLGIGASSAACGLLIGVNDIYPAPVDGAEAGGPDVSGPDSAADETSVPEPTPKWVGGRSTQGTGATVTVPSIANVQEGDLLIAAWMGMNTDQLIKPTVAGWVGLGGGHSHDGGSNNSYWIGYHVVRSPETEATTYDFHTEGGPDVWVEMVAYRGVRAIQPIDPAVAEDIVATCDGGVVSAMPPTLVTSARSAVVYVVGTSSSTAGDQTGLLRAQSEPGLVIYRTPSLLAVGTTAPRPDVGAIWTSCPTAPDGVYFGASLGIIGGP